MAATKILFIQAARHASEYEYSPPLGLMYLAACLQPRGDASVRILDMQVLGRRIEPVIDRAVADPPDWIGLSGMTPDAEVIGALARSLKHVLPAAPIVVGGPHATHWPHDLMKQPAVDFLLSGEGETAVGAFLEFVGGSRPAEQTPNLVYRDNGEIRFNDRAPVVENLDEIPFPAYDLIDLEAYYRITRPGILHARHRYAPLITSRGCVYHCIYCHTIHGKRYRFRSAENVVAEMKWLNERFGVGEFVVLDDLFNLLPKRVNRIAELILEQRLDIALHLCSGLRGDLMTEESIALLKRAGMYRCMFGIDTASPRLQKLTRRNLNIEKVSRAIETSRRHGLMVHGTFMLGFPTETWEEAQATVDFALRSNLHTAAFHQAIPFPGTEMFDLAVEQGALNLDDKENYDFKKGSKINASRMSDAVLARVRRRAYRRFYFSAKRLWMILTALPNRWRLIPHLFAVWLRRAFPW